MLDPEETGGSLLAGTLDTGRAALALKVDQGQGRQGVPGAPFPLALRVTGLMLSLHQRAQMGA